jgi:hypothetical protein
MSNQITLLTLTLTLREMLLEAYEKEDKREIQNLFHTFYILTEAIMRMGPRDDQGYRVSDEDMEVYRILDLLYSAAQHGAMFDGKFFKAWPPTVDEIERAFAKQPSAGAKDDV